jgi:hypothetical protein
VDRKYGRVEMIERMAKERHEGSHDDTTVDAAVEMLRKRLDMYQIPTLRLPTGPISRRESMEHLVS